MALAKITNYNLAIFIHVASVLVAFGAIFVYPMVTALAHRSGLPAIAFWRRMQYQIGRTFISFGMLVALVAGIYLASEGPYDFGEWWVGTGIVIIVVIGGIGGAFFGPTEQKLAELAERDAATGATEPSDEYKALAARHANVSYVAIALVVFALFIMTTKPGSPG